MVKDIHGNIYSVYKDDPRYLSGELVHMNKGRVHKNLRGKFYAKDKNNKIFLISKDDKRFVSGELKAVNRKDKPKIVPIKKPRKKTKKSDKFRLSQIQYNVNKRKLKYPDFKYDIFKNEGNYFIKNYYFIRFFKKRDEV